MEGANEAREEEEMGVESESTILRILLFELSFNSVRLLMGLLKYSFYKLDS